MKRFKPFFITRARLAERLTMADIQVMPCENIYDPDKPAWKCALTEPAAVEIQAYYTEIGKPCPEIVLQALRQ